MTAIHPAYRGRFAPTPSGPLHLGSLLTALLSYLDARAAEGSWLLRIDDLDRARCDAAHTTRILRQLEAHGMHWDEAPRYQSAALADYEHALAALRASDRIYGCDCTRKRLKAENREGTWGAVYSGRCRARGLPSGDPGAECALRMRVPEGVAQLADDWRGELKGDWYADVGDFVLRRRDGIPGYALTSAVDEHAMGITHVVRGADLLVPTLTHWAVLDALGYPRPRSRHGPLLQRGDGTKLSKQNHAAPIDEAEAGANLLRCCTWLGVAPEAATATDAPEAILRSAVDGWRRRQAQGIPLPAVVALEESPADNGRATVPTDL